MVAMRKIMVYKAKRNTLRKKGSIDSGAAIVLTFPEVKFSIVAKSGCLSSKPDLQSCTPCYRGGMLMCFSTELARNDS